LLKEAKVNARLMVLSTRAHGRIIQGYPTTLCFNRMVVYYPADTANYYVLDASGRYNTYNTIPRDLVGIDAFVIDADKNQYNFITLKNGKAEEAVMMQGELDADGKLQGNIRILSSVYNRAKYLAPYDDLGEKKYIRHLQDDNPGLAISALKIENKDNDTLPLIQTFNFDYKQAAPDDGYLYVNPVMFKDFRSNPFLSGTRVSNIDFGCLNNYTFIARFKVPAGYKTDVLPQSTSMQMPGKGIVFKRVTAEQDGIITLRYTIAYKQAFFSKEEYTALKDFYKKMFEMLNEQIVLKKS
jgi:hypothetical protein